VSDFGGFTSATRRLVQLSDGRSAFAKGATDDLTERWLRAEHDVYTQLGGSFMPELLGWDDSGPRPILLIEDLSRAHWPPPWRPGDVDLVLAALEELHRCPTWLRLPRLEDEYPSSGGWQEVAADPGPFLSVGLASSDWLDTNLDLLRSASDRAARSGEAVVHGDIRSDNLCLLDGRARIVDWNWASVGNPDADITFWFPSLVLEGGAPPFEPSPELMAWVSGFFASYAGLPQIPNAPGVRAIQLAQLRIALPWTCRLLQIEPPDGNSGPPRPGITVP
jgi:Phosphotransferase enzyme family